MALDRMLGFSLKPVRIDPDGEVSRLAPPSHPAGAAIASQDGAARAARLFEKTRIEGLTAPPVHEERAPEPAAAPATGPVAPAPAPREPPTPRSGERAPDASALSKLRGLAGRGSRAILILGAFSAVIGFGSAVLWSRALHRPAAPVRATAAESALAWKAASTLSAVVCARQREPKQVLADVSSTHALEAHSVSDRVDVLIGAAIPSGAGVGLVLNATTLEARELVRDNGSRELLGVVPAADAEPYEFVIDRATVGGYRDARTLPGQTALALARTNAGVQLVRRREQRSIALWPLNDGEELSRPRAEWLDAGRLAVTLRRGGRTGTLAIGWLDPERAQRSVLRDVPLGKGEIGLPSLSVQAGRAVVAAAVRLTPAHPWRIQAATSVWQGSAKPVPLPELAARPELDTFAPSIAALGDSRWLLQWTEGREGERRVRAITLDADLRPIGAPISVSPQDTSAGGGLAIRVDQGLLSLFLVQKPSGYDLWATTLACH
jgi:hypothetical protein